MDSQEIPFLSASDLGRLIESGEVSPVQATEAYLRRIEQVDDKHNSYITVTREYALASARRPSPDRRGQLPRPRCTASPWR